MMFWLVGAIDVAVMISLLAIAIGKTLRVHELEEELAYVNLELCHLHERVQVPPR